MPTTITASAPAANPVWSILTLNGFAYSLQFGILLACELDKGGAANGIALEMSGDQPNWVQVGGFSMEPHAQREIDAAFTGLISLDSESSLIEEYRTWCAQEGVPHVSADEHDVDSLTPAQRNYLGRFIQRWERLFSKLQRTEPVLSHSAWLREGVLL